MGECDVRVRHIFRGTYTAVVEDHGEAESVVAEDRGLVLGGNIHTTWDDGEVTNWKFGYRLDLQVLSVRQRDGKSPMSVSGDRIEELRKGIVEAIRQLLHDHITNAIRFPREDYDPVWVIWFDKNGDPYECRMTGLRITGGSLTVLIEEEESGSEVECYSPFRLGASNIDWLSGIYEAVWQQLEKNKKVEPQAEGR